MIALSTESEILPDKSYILVVTHKYYHDHFLELDKLPANIRVYASSYAGEVPTLCLTSTNSVGMTPHPPSVTLIGDEDLPQAYLDATVSGNFPEAPP